jgi:uncharacterized protein YegP (UPF0339 family)
MDHIEFYQEETNKDWRWRVRAANSKIVGASTEGYSRQTNAKNNLRSLMKYCRDVDIRIASEMKVRPPEATHPLHFYKDPEGMWRWRVTAQNGQIVHASTEGFENRVDAVRDLEILVDLVKSWDKP